ncbi:MAG: hypothetical protein DDT29_02548 [Dehalococcoidia bacterium]|nr:hypothetical protein [Bacillota bacterium]
MAKVNVYDDDGNIVARVKYTDNLDRWDGRNWSSGGTGYHKGITQLADGRYVLVHGTQWQGDRDRAVIISAECAVREILKSDDEDLLDTYGLRKLADEILIGEAD